MHTQHLGQTGAGSQHGNLGIAAARSLPGAVHQVLDKGKGNIVEHQSKQGLIGAPLCLADCREQAVQTAQDHGRSHHQQDQRDLREDGGGEQAEPAGSNGAYQDLALSTDVPELHTARGEMESRLAIRSSGSLG